MIDELVIELKENEGFSPTPYKDTEGFDTIGYGTKLPLSKLEATVLLRMRLVDKIKHLEKVKPLVNQLPLEVQSILANMAYQMGVSGLLGFKKMWKHLENHDFKEASKEGLDSLWNKQTPHRAKRLMDRMAKC